MTLQITLLLAFAVTTTVLADTEWLIRTPRRSPPGPTCKPGESYFDGCNFCQCSSYGTPSCTYKGCASYDKNGFPTGVPVQVDPPRRPPYIAVDPPRPSGKQPPYIAVDPPKFPSGGGYPGRPPYIAVDPPYNPNKGGYYRG